MEELIINLGSFRPCGYIGDTNVKSCPPGAGPVRGGYMQHNEFEIQRAFCSTYTKAHDLKSQTIYLPNGNIGQCMGILHV